MTDADVPRVTQRFQRVLQLSFFTGIVAIVVLPRLLGWDSSLDATPLGMWLFLFVPGMVSVIAIRLWALRGLTRVEVEESDLVRVDKRQAMLSYARELGMPMLAFLTAAGVVMTAGQVWVLVQDHPWWSWMATPVFIVMTGYMAWQLWLLRRDKARTGGSDMAVPPVP